MKTFSYTIKDEIGLHARPAGLLVKAAKQFSSEITIEKDGKTAGAQKLMMLMGLGIKQGDTIIITINGGDEEKSFNIMKEFFEENL